MTKMTSALTVSIISPSLSSFLPNESIYVGICGRFSLCHNLYTALGSQCRAGFHYGPYMLSICRDVLCIRVIYRSSLRRWFERAFAGHLNSPIFMSSGSIIAGRKFEDLVAAGPLELSLPRVLIIFEHFMRLWCIQGLGILGHIEILGWKTSASKKALQGVLGIFMYTIHTLYINSVTYLLFRKILNSLAE